MIIIDIINEINQLFLEIAPYLLLGLIFVGLLNLFITKELVAKHIGKNNIASVIKASILGVPLPLCSCGVVPSAVYMSKNGASKSAIVSFLISTPQTGIDSIIATYGMMGWLFAIFRPFAAFFMGIAGGSIINLITKNENKPETNFFKIESNENICYTDICDDEKQKESKIKRFFRYSFVEFLDDISMHFVIGLIIAGLITYFIPTNFIENTPFNSGIPGMLLMIIVGIPMYICATSSIPIAVALMIKGFSPGVAFVFLAVGPATNAASLTIISKILGKKTTTIYVLLIAILAIISGLLLDKIFEIFKINQNQILNHIHHQHGDLINDELKLILAAIFLILLLASLYRKIILSKLKSKEKAMISKTIKIGGMSCNHCVTNIKKAISSIEGVNEVDVNLEQGEAYIKGDFDLSKVEKAVTEVGYEIIK